MVGMGDLTKSKEADHDTIVSYHVKGRRFRTGAQSRQRGSGGRPTRRGKAQHAVARLQQSAGPLSLSAGDSIAGPSLDCVCRPSRRPGPEPTLAAEWGCDASNATWIVDRLEQRGLA